MIFNTSTFSSSPHFHHQQYSVLENENNKNPKDIVDQPNNMINNFVSSKNNLVLQQPQTNNNHTQGRILKITFFMSSARNDNNNNNNNAVVVVDHGEKKQQNMKSFSCNVCKKSFSSNKALNGHMRSHTQKGFKKSTTTTASPLSSSSLLELEQNKKRNHHQDHDQLPPAIDLSNYLPPRTYKTNKRRNRFFNDDDARIAAQALLDMSRGKFLSFDDYDVNNRDCKSF
ncbi:zinc finger protein [Trifolium repens]|nr:zinc finger protein [Trifolium repens]